MIDTVWTNSFRAPEAEGSIDYHALSVVVNFSHFDFSYETAERNSTKLDRKQDLNII